MRWTRPPVASSGVWLFGHFGSSRVAREREWTIWCSYWSRDAERPSPEDQFDLAKIAMLVIGLGFALASVLITTILHALIDYSVAVSNSLVIFPVLYTGYLWIFASFAPKGPPTVLWCQLLSFPVEIFLILISYILALALVGAF